MVLPKLLLVHLLIVFSVVYCDDDAEKRIIGGQKAEPEQFPFVAYLRAERNGKKLPIGCAATIIDASTLVTAAHCCEPSRPNDDISDLTNYAYIGNPSTADEKDVIKSRVEKCILHPKYSSTTWNGINPFGYDAAVIKLAEPLSFSSKVQPIEMIPANIKRNSTGITMGWGVTGDETNPHSSPDLLYAAHHIYDSDECKNKISRTWGALYGTFCAGGVDKTAACFGDDGGPFVVSQDGKWFFAGITSVVRGANICPDTETTQYTDVQHPCIAGFLQNPTAKAEDLDCQ